MTSSRGDPAFASELTITLSTDPNHVVAWLEHHGHRAFNAGAIRGPERQDAILFDDGPGTRTRMCRPGDTLTVEPDGTITVT